MLTIMLIHPPLSKLTLRGHNPLMHPQILLQYLPSGLRPQPPPILIPLHPTITHSSSFPLQHIPRINPPQLLMYLLVLPLYPLLVLLPTLLPCRLLEPGMGLGFGLAQRSDAALDVAEALLVQFVLQLDLEQGEQAQAPVFALQLHIYYRSELWSYKGRSMPGFEGGQLLLLEDYHGGAARGGGGGGLSYGVSGVQGTAGLFGRGCCCCAVYTHLFDVWFGFASQQLGGFEYVRVRTGTSWLFGLFALLSVPTGFNNNLLLYLNRFEQRHPLILLILLLLIFPLLLLLLPPIPNLRQLLTPSPTPLPQIQLAHRLAPPPAHPPYPNQILLRIIPHNFIHLPHSPQLYVLQGELQLGYGGLLVRYGLLQFRQVDVLFEKVQFQLFQFAGFLDQSGLLGQFGQFLFLAGFNPLQIPIFMYSRFIIEKCQLPVYLHLHTLPQLPFPLLKPPNPILHPLILLPGMSVLPLQLLPSLAFHAILNLKFAHFAVQFDIHRTFDDGWFGVETGLKPIDLAAELVELCELLGVLQKEGVAVVQREQLVKEALAVGQEEGVGGEGLEGVGVGELWVAEGFGSVFQSGRRHKTLVVAYYNFIYNGNTSTLLLATKQSHIHSNHNFPALFPPFPLFPFLTCSLFTLSLNSSISSVSSTLFSTVFPNRYSTVLPISFSAVHGAVLNSLSVFFRTLVSFKARYKGGYILFQTSITYFMGRVIFLVDQLQMKPGRRMQPQMFGVESRASQAYFFVDQQRCRYGGLPFAETYTTFFGVSICSSTLKNESLFTCSQLPGSPGFIPFVMVVSTRVPTECTTISTSFISFLQFFASIALPMIQLMSLFWGWMERGPRREREETVAPWRDRVRARQPPRQPEPPIIRTFLEARFVIAGVIIQLLWDGFGLWRNWEIMGIS